MLDHAITAYDALREHVGEPQQRVLDKQLDHLDRHCRHFIARSPIAMLATADAEARLDCSPRGGPPGFARVLHAPPRAPPARSASPGPPAPTAPATAARTRTPTCSRTPTSPCSSCCPAGTSPC